VTAKTVLAALLCAALAACGGGGDCQSCEEEAEAPRPPSGWVNGVNIKELCIDPYPAVPIPECQPQPAVRP
jgi:hypothetical protein